MRYRALKNADRHSTRLSEQKWLKRRASAGVWYTICGKPYPSILFAPPGVRHYKFPEHRLDTETLRIITFSCAILFPMWVIGPLMRKGSRYWLLLVAIFLFLLGANYAVFATSFPPQSAFLRALLVAGVMLGLGYVWAVVKNKIAASQTLEREASVPK